MLLQQTCMLCGKPSEIEVDDAKYAIYRMGIEMGAPAVTHGIQVIFSDLSADDRETIMTGTHPACFDGVFADEDDPDE